MAKKETFKSFLRSLRTFPREVQNSALKAWNAITLQTMGDAQTFAPQTTQQSLTKSMVPPIKAKITSKGIRSALVARVPYARRLEEGTDLNFKNPGEISYYITGLGPVRKLKKGGAKYMQRAIDKNEGFFIDAIADIIGREWAE